MGSVRRAKLQRLARNSVGNSRRRSECELFKLVSGRVPAMEMEMEFVWFYCVFTYRRVVWDLVQTWDLFSSVSMRPGIHKWKHIFVYGARVPAPRRTPDTQPYMDIHFTFHFGNFDHTFADRRPLQMRYTSRVWNCDRIQTKYHHFNNGQTRKYAHSAPFIF